MNCIKKLLNKHKDELPFILAFLVYIILIHLCTREYVGDALQYFKKVLDNYSLLDGAIMRYNTWTSRVIIEIPLYFITHNMHVYIWAFLDIIILIILALSLMKLTQYKQNKLIILLIILYPFTEMSSAGWIATTINYLWPLALGCTSFVLLDKMYRNEHISLLSILIFMLCELFSTNFETFSVFYFIILTYFTVNMIIEHKFTAKKIVLTVMQFLISIFNICFALVCPGNWVRSAAEVTRWMVDFNSLTPIDKFALGVLDTSSKLIMNNILFLLFTLVLFVITLKKSKSKLVTILSALPMCSVLLITVLFPLSQNYLSSYSLLFERSTNINPMTFNSPLPYIAFAFFVIIMTICVVLLLNAGKSVKSGILVALVFSVGFATRVVLGFSPTLYASLLRTFIFLDFSMIYCIVRVFDDNKELFENNKYFSKYSLVIGTTFVIFYALNTLIAISSQY